MRLETNTIDVPHLGGITASYALSSPFFPVKPTLVLLNSFTTNAQLYRPQFANEDLLSVCNLLAIELVGHGGTRVKHTKQFTYWDSAVMALQVMDSLKIDKAFALGTSQGGWVAARMALLAPEKILGIVPLGTSMDSENPRTVSLGCWDGHASVMPVISACASSSPTPDWEPSDDYCAYMISSGMGEVSKEVMDFWKSEIKCAYKGDEGRERMKMAAINLKERDGLHARLDGVRCPVLWMQGTHDQVFSTANANEDIKCFVNSPSATLEIIPGGQHFLSATHPEIVDSRVQEFIKLHSLKSRS